MKLKTLELFGGIGSPIMKRRNRYEKKNIVPARFFK